MASLPNSGKKADYIPILEEQDSNWFTVSVCTVDGQTFSYGNTEKNHAFSIQSGVKPWLYAAAVEQHGLKKVHRHIGIEPSGLAFNEVSLNADDRPHNPMINAGAIVTGSLVRSGLDMAGKFRFFRKFMSDVVGGSKIGFSQPTYLCEQETAFRNNALMYYMDNAGVFPADVNPTTALDFYFQACSIEVTPQMAANAAATLAAGGVSPLTGKRCFSPVTTKSCLTLMFSCGMYDYSGEWCTKIGLPAKSGVSGVVYVVIPHVMGIAVFSPPLDSHGNSVRAVEFYKRLLQKYKFGVFDHIVTGMQSASIQRSLSQNTRSMRAERGRGKRHSYGRSKKHNMTLAQQNKSLALDPDRDSPGDYSSTSTPVARADPYDGESSNTSTADQYEESTKLSSEANEACASGHILERWRQTVRTIARFFRRIRTICIWCDYVFKTDVYNYSTFRETESAEYLSEEQTLLRDYKCEVSPSTTPRWIPLDFVYRLLSEFGIGPVDRKHMPALNDDIKKVRQESQRMRDYLKSTACNRLKRKRGVSRLDTTRFTKSELYAELSDLFPFAPPGFNFGLSLLEDNDELEVSNPDWNYNGMALERWKRAPFLPNSCPDITRRCEEFGSREFLYVPSIITMQGSTTLPRAILNKLAFPWFKLFRHEMTSIADLAKKDVRHRIELAEKAQTNKEAPSCASVYGDVVIEELLHANPESLGISVCTVDGQQFNWGDSSKEVPLMSAVQPLLYSLALKNNGIEETQTWIGTEPTSISPNSFSLMDVPLTNVTDGQKEVPKARPFNPFMDSGALQTCALISKRAYRNAGSRFMNIIEHIQSLAGGRQIGYNNSVFLAQKEKRLKTLAVSHFMKGMGSYPSSIDPTDMAHLLFQSQSVEMSCQTLSIIAASLANLGVCPMTQEKVLDESDLISLFSLMYNCGLNQFTGTWAFNVGIPASAGVSGACLIIVPNIMGIALYSPMINNSGVPPAALKFCECLTNRYRVNIFDQLVYRDEELDIRTDQSEENADFSNLSERQRSTLLFFELCTAANWGDIKTVKQVLDEGVDVNQADYDRRTALHIASCENRLEITQMLLQEGANMLAEDRWGMTPYAEAKKHQYSELVELFEEEMKRRNISLPHHRNG